MKKYIFYISTCLLTILSFQGNNFGVSNLQAADYAWATFDAQGNAFYTITSNNAIYHTKLVNGTYTTGVKVATGKRPYVSPDGTKLFYDHQGSIYLQVKKKYTNDWHPAVKLNSTINATDNQSCASLSTNGKYLIYTRDLVNCDFVHTPFDFNSNADLPPYNYKIFQNKVVEVDQLFTVNTLSDSIFMDDNGINTLTYSAQLQGGGTLPNGLTLNTQTGILSGILNQVGTYTIQVTATDPSNNTTTSSLTVQVNSKLLSNIEIERSSLVLFPNPATDHIFIKQPSSSKTLNYQIQTINGQLLKQGQVKQNTINVSDLQKGQYIINLQSTNSRWSKSIVIQ